MKYPQSREITFAERTSDAAVRLLSLLVMVRDSATERMAMNRPGTRETDRPKIRDQLYAVPGSPVADFDFDTGTAAVFDDMLGRSVPFYGEIQRMIKELVTDFAVDGTNIYDLGCSTCATFRNLRDLGQNVMFIGIDDSAAMLERARRELARAGFERPYVLREQDLHAGLEIENASVVIMCLTLQFIRPLHRERLMRAIYNGMNHQACLILVEKILAENGLMNRLFIKHYYDLKRRNGYSDIEISQKREALENVLVPYRLRENEELLSLVGFRSTEIFFKWYNFCGLLGFK
jgi:tRNA (cmo5U34)-methyltransferase